MWRNLHFKNFRWSCHLEKTSWINFFSSKHNLFRQSKPQRDVGHQMTHIVLFKSPRITNHFSTRSAQPGIGSVLVHCYPDAASVPYGHLRSIVDWPVATNIRSITLFYKKCIHSAKNGNNDWLKQIKSWTINTRCLFTLQVLQSVLCRCKNLFLQSYPKELVRFLCDCTVHLIKRILQNLEGTSVDWIP